MAFTTRGMDVTPATPRLDAAAVAAAFGLGDVREPPVPVPGGRSHPLWRLRTGSGVWAVKRLNRPREAWWDAEYAVAAAVQENAFRHGIAMPRPVHPLRPAAPLLADLRDGEGELRSFLVHAWCDGAQVPETGVPRAVRRWAGRTLAALHALPAPPGVGGAPVLRRPHAVAEWREALDGAPGDVPDGFVGAVRRFLPDVARAVGLVGAALERPGAAPVFTHADVKPDNVLVTAGGPVLLDWDGARADLAAWEVVRAGLAFGRTARGPGRAGFLDVLGAYREAGGAPVEAAPEAFAGEVDRRVGGAAWLLWRALGHRPVSAAERAASYGHVLEYLAELRRVLRSAERWTAWLADARRP